MGETIDGINEFLDDGLDFGRCVDHFSELGDPELFCLIKSQEGAVLQYFHYISSLEIGKYSDFIGYYHEIVGKQSVLPKSSMKKHVKVIGGICYSWDAFNRIDVVFNTSNDSAFSAYTLRISAILRFYLMPVDLFCSVFGGISRDYQCLSIRQVSSISLPDVIFVLKHGFSSDEFLVSITRIMLCYLSTKEISQILQDFLHVYPRMAFHLVSLLPLNSSLMVVMKYVLIEHLEFFSDCLDIAECLINILIKTNDFNNCSKYIPLLRNSLNINPKYSLVLAKLYISNEMGEDALSMLNIASLLIPDQVQTGNLPCSNRTVYGNSLSLNRSQTEQTILKTPLNGLMFVFESLMNDFVCLPSSNDIIQKRSKTYGYMCPEIVYNYPENRQPNCYLCTNTDEFFLCDPGVEQISLNMKEIAELPLTNRLIDTAKRMLKNQTRPTKNNSKSIKLNVNSHALIESIKIHDGAGFDTILRTKMQTKKIDTSDLILAAKANMDGITGISFLGASNMCSFSEKNAHDCVKALIPRILQVERINT